jgi:hypothetical protein
MKHIIEDLIAHLETIKNSAPIKHGDLSDLGNEIGIVIGRYTDDKDYDKEGFTSGISHGISISDGTHRF